MSEARETEFYTVAEAARVLAVSPVTIWRWIKANRLRAYRIGPRNIRIKKEDLDQMVQPAWAGQDLEVCTTAERVPLILEPPSEEELARRRELYERIMARRKELVITPLTAADLVHKARSMEWGARARRKR
jgi:excisionase family DNA binding protein